MSELIMDGPGLVGDHARSELRPVRRANLRDEVKSALRAAIVSGEMEPGVVYSAPQLSQTFGVSATPVREAMLDLVREGLVVSLPNKGFRVTEMSETDLDELAQLRVLLEPPTIRAVVPLVPAEDFGRLRGLAERIVDAAEAGDLVRYVAGDTDFHLALLGYAQNARLLTLVAELRSQTRLTGLRALLDRGRLVESALEHRVIMDLVEARDVAGAEDYLRRHIGHVRGLWAGRSR